MQNNSADTQFVSSASFETPKFVPPISGWGGHAPFAFWLIEALKPRTLVELGTHYGYSYFCFCQQVMLQKLPTRCAAVDSWKGDKHAGLYDESVFNLVQKINSERYESFSRLVRATFAEALDQFADNSIDLLHIDGRHRYEDVKQDFESWLPKLSDTGIVLIHDTQVQGLDFGVFRYWKELASKFPHFEFTHEYGLGVLGVGKAVPDKLRSLFDAASYPDKVAAIRTSYQRLALALYGRRIRRMEPCPCGSGERFKHCHGTLSTQTFGE
ncbi:class I SAM-dependent methyltransferase [Bradyrhizobium sp.]|uniref:class I SAM-dependent methyltransferase n=1 Tax=Bradyrhizobium sp. TaxID=376 RepID=UPI0025BA044B|nr:class I SAM-dependent methyltransferase [Bradyrhizobium sp.]